MFSGAWVALATPFRRGAVDAEACLTLVDRTIEGGIDGLVVCGTTAETPTLTPKEQAEWVERAVARAAGRVPVVVGTGTYSTEETIERSKAAASAGASGLLVVTPYYNRPGPEGLRRHFRAVADATPLPILLYNIPSRTGTSMSPALIAELCEHPRVQGVKDSTGSTADVMALVERGVTVLAGDDASTLTSMALGASGVVSVLANALPGEVAGLVRDMARGDLARARDRHYRLLPLFRALFLESNPAPLKALLEHLGVGTSEVRSPLAEVTDETRRQLLAAYDLAVRPVEGRAAVRP